MEMQIRGGVVGGSSNLIEYCVNKCFVNGGSGTGGIVGATNYNINKCGNYGNTNSSSGFIGGIAGIVSQDSQCTNISNCYNFGNITAGTDDVGGIIGALFNYGVSVQNCYNRGNINAKSGNRQAGGIVGDSYNRGSNSSAGTKKIVNCYNTGTITGSRIGSFVGQNQSTEIRNSMATTSTVASYSNRATLISSSIGCSISTLQSSASKLGEAYIADGKKIDKDGNIVDNKNNDGNIVYINNGYPILKWQVTN